VAWLFILDSLFTLKFIMMNTITTPAKVSSFFNKILMSFLALLVSVVSFAQETKKVDVDINTNSGGGGFFASPWVWVIGAAIFILLLVALLRSGSSKSA
jgi:hypothetical protein